MDVMPSRPEVFLLTGGAAAERSTVDRGGRQLSVSAELFEVLEFVQAAAERGLAVQVTALRQELPVDEAADAVEMGRDELRLYIGQGRIPSRSSQYVDWVRLSDVLELSRKVDAERKQALSELANELRLDE
ncbi:hypothetical protein GCM10009789_27020 [Kribbella sancticallisti]|uniref:Helix-turn-helix domain-containing protein n=1 Tax=Kribbella sancticallisti TaxID=460087 RepID=A0ABN2D7J9_9ACTN